MHRAATIALHWLSLLTLILLVASGGQPILAWIFALSGLAICAIALTQGLLNGPGPKLQGVARTAHSWLSRAMYAALCLVVALTFWDQLGGAWRGPTPPEIHFYLLSAASLHAIFHLWRHTALGDGALRRITPKPIHGSL